MRTFLTLTALVAVALASACQGGAEIHVEKTVYKTTWADPTVGMIIVDSNAACAPFIIKSRDEKLTFESCTYEELELPVDAYSLEFQPLPEYSQTPPLIGNAICSESESTSPLLELKKGEIINITGLYAP